MKQRGLTLLEVMLATGLVGLLSSAVLGWHLYFQHSLYQQQQKNQAEQGLHHWLHWLWRDLQSNMADSWHYDASHQCLLYGDVGVRVKSNSLQWRPQSATCGSAGWQALSNPGRVKFTKLQVNHQQLCLTARGENLVRTEACLPWPL